MILGIVTGNIYSTINHKCCDGKKLMIVEKLNPDSSLKGGYVIAIDTVGAGIGEKVIIIDEGNSARQVLGNPDDPIRSVIVGIVDQIAI